MDQTQRSQREQLARLDGGLARLDGGQGRSDVVGRRLVASWRRSADYGVSLDLVSPAFAGDVDDESLFYESGRQVLTDLTDTLADEPVSMMLTDADGLVLNRLCEESRLVRALDRVHLAPGFDYSERETGTTGLGLALADRAPSLVRADEHYCTGLWGYTCAAAPVEDPASGALMGTVNLTTWSQQSYALLLALAQTAARQTEALMLARAHGRTPRPNRRGRVFRVRPALREDAGGAAPPRELSTRWREAFDEVSDALAAGRGVAVVGEAGTGKAALLGQAHAHALPGRRVLVARPPEPADVAEWLALWSPELAKAGTGVVVGPVDGLPAWVAAELADLVRSHGGRLALTATEADGIPEGLRALVDVVVEVAPLRLRPDDVTPLARSVARQTRGHEVRFTPAARSALASYHWPGNVTQLRDVVRAAATRADVVDARDLPPEVFTGAAHKLTRMEAIERDEIVRCLCAPGGSAERAAAELGMSRATVYRRIARYGIRRPGDRTADEPTDGPSRPARETG